MNRISNLLIICLLCSFSVFKYANSGDRGIQTITSDEILSAGLTRPGDIFRLIDFWDIFTIDGFKWHGSVQSPGIFQDDSWKLFVDDQPVDIELWNGNHINLIPYSIDQIDSVIVYNSPTVLNGQFIRHGAIQIIIKKPQQNIELQGRNSIGNETGDPGPFFYTSHRSPNIDRIGPDYSFSVNGKYRNNYVQSNFQNLNHYDTDPRVVNRSQNIDLELFEGQVSSISAIISRESVKASHRLTFGHSTTKDFPISGEFGSGILFLETAAREIPMQQQLSHAGINGFFQISRESQFKYLFSASNIAIEEAGTLLADPDWKHSHYQLNLQLREEQEPPEKQIGLNFHQMRLICTDKLRRNPIRYLDFYGGAPILAASDISASLWGSMGKTDRGWFGDIILKNKWKISQRSELNANLSYSRGVSPDENLFWYWVEQGYRFPLQAGPDLKFTGTDKSPGYFSMEMSWKKPLLKNGYYQMGLNYYVFSNILLKDQYVYFDEFDILLASPAQLSRNHNGQTIAFHSAINLKSRNTSHRLIYRLQTVLGGDSLFRTLSEAIPKHHLIYSMQYKPVNSFQIGLTAHYRSAAKWKRYQFEMFSIGEVIYRSAIDDMLIIDAGFHKWFWNRQLYFSASFRNLLNQDEIYHPLGARLNLRWFVQFGFNIGANFEKR